MPDIDLAVAIKQKCVDCKHFRLGTVPMGHCSVHDDHRHERYWCDSWTDQNGDAPWKSRRTA